MILTEKGTAGDTYVVLFLAGEIGNSRKSRNSQTILPLHSRHSEKTAW